MRKGMGLLVISTLAYSVAAVVAYVSAVNLPLSVMLLCVTLGFAVGAACQIKYFGMIIRRGKRERRWHVSVIGAAALTVAAFFVYFGYTKFPLSDVYPLLVASTIVFLAIDLLINRRRLSAIERTMLIAGVLVVAVGTVISGWTSFTFQPQSLPLVFGIIVFAGIGFYALLYDVKDYHSGTKLAYMTASFLVITALLFFFDLPTVVNTAYVLTAVATGFFWSIAVGTEMQVMRLIETASRKANVISRNFVNNFTYLDLVFVLIASALIGSYSVYGIFGGCLVVAGVIILGVIK